jgi:hypothetical protein
MAKASSSSQTKNRQRDRPSGGGPTNGQANKGTDLLSVDCRGSWKGSLELVHLCRTMNGWWGGPVGVVFEQRDRPSGGRDRQMDRPLARGGRNRQRNRPTGPKPAKVGQGGKGRPRGQAFWREGIGSGAGWKTGIGLRVWVYGERDAGISGRSAGALRARAILFPGPRSFSGAGCFLLVPWGSFRGTNGYGDPAPGCCSYPAGWVVAGEGLGGSGRMRKKRRTTMRSR